MATPHVLPQGETLGTYRSHDDVQATIAYLAENDFNVRALSIVGADVKIVETVMGLTSWAQAAGRGALTGAWLGMILGLFMSFFGGDQSLTPGSLLPGLVIGIGLGILWGIATRALMGRKSRVIARPQVVANQFELICEPSLANQAKGILATRGAS